MSRANLPGPMVSRATNNVYTALAFVSFAATAAALIYVVVQFLRTGIL